MKMLKTILLMLTMLTLLPFACAEELAPIDAWLDGKNPAPAPYAPNPDCFLPDNGGYIDESLSITLETSFWTEDVASEKLSTAPPSRAMAAAKELLVRVLTS